MIRIQSATLVLVSLLLTFLIAHAVEPDWALIDSFTAEQLPCPAGSHIDKSPYSPYHRCVPTGPFINFVKGHISSKGIEAELGNEGTSTVAIHYTPEGRITSRGEHIWRPGIFPVQVGKWEYWWPSGAKRLVVVFEARDVVLKEFKQYDNQERKPKALSLTLWDEDGNEVPASLLPIECSDLAGSGKCPWRMSGPIRKYVEVVHPGLMVTRVLPDVLGLHDAILKLFGERDLKLAYSGQSERVVLVLTSPRSKGGDVSSHYRVRIEKSANCSNKGCEASLTAFRVDAPIRAENIDWSKSKEVDDEITQRVAQLLDQEIAKSQKEIEQLRGLQLQRNR